MGLSHLPGAQGAGRVGAVGWVPTLEGQDLLSQAVPSIHTVPPIHARLLGGGEKTGWVFLSLHSCLFFLLLLRRKAVSFLASSPSACGGRGRQSPAAVGPGSCSASWPRLNAGAFEPEQQKGFTGSASLELGGDLFPTHTRGCEVGSGWQWSVWTCRAGQQG